MSLKLSFVQRGWHRNCHLFNVDGIETVVCSTWIALKLSLFNVDGIENVVCSTWMALKLICSTWMALKVSFVQREWH